MCKHRGDKCAGYWVVGTGRMAGCLNSQVSLQSSVPPQFDFRNGHLTSVLICLLEWQHELESKGSDTLLTHNEFQTHLGALDPQCLVIPKEAPEG
jgi:hypothetical protein